MRWTLVRILLLVTIVLAAIFVSVVYHDTQQEIEKGPYWNYDRVNKTYPVMIIIYGVEDGKSFKEVKYNNSGKECSVSDISNHLVDGSRRNEINTIYTDDDESYITHEYCAKDNSFPRGVYTLYYGKNAPVQGTTTSYHSGKSEKTAQTNIVYQKTGSS